MSDHLIPIWPDTPPGFEPSYQQPVPTLAPFLLHSGGPHAAVLVLPGGGYAGKADYEGAPIARWLNTLGISAFVLDYRVTPYHHPVPLMDAKRALQVIRSRADEWHIDPNKVGILGFSAGGHLASTSGTLLDDPAEMKIDGTSILSSRPDAMILCYPVISFGEYGHVGSMENLLGTNPPAAQRAALSTDQQVTKATPPAFIWHTANDDAVPVKNSLLFAQALSTQHIPFELHIFPDGRHGLAMGETAPQVAQWTSLCAAWFKQIGFTNPRY